MKLNEKQLRKIIKTALMEYTYKDFQNDLTKRTDNYNDYDMDNYVTSGEWEKDMDTSAKDIAKTDSKFKQKMDNAKKNKEDYHEWLVDGSTNDPDSVVSRTHNGDSMVDKHIKKLQKDAMWNAYDDLTSDIKDIHPEFNPDTVFDSDAYFNDMNKNIYNESKINKIVAESIKKVLKEDIGKNNDFILYKIAKYPVKSLIIPANAVSQFGENMVFMAKENEAVRMADSGKYGSCITVISAPMDLQYEEKETRMGLLILVPYSELKKLKIIDHTYPVMQTL